MIKAEWTNNDALSTEQTTQTNAPNTLDALDCISRQAAIRWVKTECNPYGKPTIDFESGKKVIEYLKRMPSVHPDARLKKIEDLVDGSIDHFDKDDAMDLLYQIKEVLKDGLY